MTGKLNFRCTCTCQEEAKRTKKKKKKKKKRKKEEKNTPQWSYLTLLHSERPKLYIMSAFLSAIGLKNTVVRCDLLFQSYREYINQCCIIRLQKFFSLFLKDHKDLDPFYKTGLDT